MVVRNRDDCLKYGKEKKRFDFARLIADAWFVKLDEILKDKG